MFFSSRFLNRKNGTNLCKVSLIYFTKIIVWKNAFYWQKKPPVNTQPILSISEQTTYTECISGLIRVFSLICVSTKIALLQVINMYRSVFSRSYYSNLSESRTGLSSFV